MNWFGKYFILLVCSAVLVQISCSKSDLEEPSDCEDIVFNTGAYEDGEEDPSTHVKEYSIQGNCLELVVTYGGGCEEHDIYMAARGWIKTEPPIVEAKLVHDNQDFCDALIIDTLRFDLDGIRYSDDPVVRIDLKELDEVIEYNYTD